MVIKVVYRKNLKMSAGKLAAQVTHAIFGLGEVLAEYDRSTRIIVLEARDQKFWDTVSKQRGYLQRDLGYTEVPEGEPTAFAWVA